MHGRNNFCGADSAVDGVFCLRNLSSGAPVLHNVYLVGPQDTDVVGDEKTAGGGAGETAAERLPSAAYNYQNTGSIQENVPGIMARYRHGGQYI